MRTYETRARDHYLFVVRIVLVATALALTTSMALAVTGLGPFSSAYLLIGFDQTTGEVDPRLAAVIHKEIGGFMAAYRADAQVEPALAKTAAEVGERLGNLDAGNLYDTLPVQEKGTDWRGFGLVGRPSAGHYRVETTDPTNAGWERLRLPAFGEVGLRARVRPAGPDVYRLTADGRFGLGNLAAPNLARLTQGVLDAIATSARHASPGESPSAAVEAQLAREWPRLYAKFTQYVRIERFVGEKTGTLDLRLVPDVEHIERRYPALAGVLERLTGTVALQSEFTSAGGARGAIELLPEPLTLRFAADDLKDLQFATVGRVPVTAMTKVHIEAQGVKLDLTDIKSHVAYELGQGGALATVALNDVPGKVEFSGYALHFIPIWLVDLFVPENLDGLTTHFLRVLATGEGGKGLRFALGVPPAAPAGTPFGASLEADVLASGFLKFALDLQSRIGFGNKALYDDVAALQGELWDAFAQDMALSMASNGPGRPARQP